MDSARGEADLGGGDGGVAKAGTAAVELEELNEFGAVEKSVSSVSNEERRDDLRRLFARLDRELGGWC